MISCLGAVASRSLVPEYLTDDHPVSDGAIAIAVLLVLLRLLAAVVAIYLARWTLTTDSKSLLHADMTDLAKKGYWQVVLLLTIISPTNSRFFPFLSGKFAVKSGGYVSMWHFKVALYTETLVCQFSEGAEVRVQLPP